MDNKIKGTTYIFQCLALVILVVIDQLTKVFARNSLNPLNNGSEISIIKGVFSLHYLENRGSVWGILQGKVDFLLIVSIILFCILVYIYIRIPKVKNYLPLMWLDTLMIAGAVGNTIDRLFFGYVTDFLYFELINFPIFNGADCWITISAFVTVILVLTHYKNDDFEFLFFKKKADKKDEE